MLSVGVKVTEYEVTPLSETDGTVAPFVHENVPATLAVPPVSIESASDCPYVMAEAAGVVCIAVAALCNVSVTVVAAML